MKNAGLDETQVGIKIAGRDINNLRYADDTTESREELKSRKWRGTKEQKAERNLDAHQQTNGQGSCGTYTPWNITQPLKRIHLNQF